MASEEFFASQTPQISFKARPQSMQYEACSELSRPQSGHTMPLPFVGDGHCCQNGNPAYSRITTTVSQTMSWMPRLSLLNATMNALMMMGKMM